MDEETEYYVSKDRGVNARNVLDRAYEESDEEGRKILMHVILYLNGSAYAVGRSNA